MAHGTDADPLPTVTESFARSLAPDRDPILREMDERADEEGFPTVGPAIGGWLRLLVRLVDARRVFEFGSGYGYSAYWMAPALPQDGEVVLTEVDADELADARGYFERGGYEGLAAFEHGDAIETIADYEGPFDVVLIDNEKHRYAEAFEAVRDRVPAGGVVVADNAIEGGSIDLAVVRALLDGTGAGGDETGESGGEEGDVVESSDADLADGAVDEMSRGIAEYLRTVRSDPDFETGLLPLGEGMTVSVRTD